MPRIHYADLGAPSGDSFELLIPRPASAPDGYTPVMLVTEWLTLNCTADWACRTNARGLGVRFASEADRGRAAARFLDQPDVVVGLGQRQARRRPRARRRQGAAA